MLNTMVRAVFRSEAELRMHTKEIAKSLGKCTPVEKIIGNRGRRSEWQGQIFE